MEQVWMELFVQFVTNGTTDVINLVYLERTREYMKKESICKLWTAKFPDRPIPPHLELFFPAYSDKNIHPDSIHPVEFPYVTDRAAGFSQPFDLCISCYRNLYDQDKLYGREMAQPLSIPYLYSSCIFHSAEMLARSVCCDFCKESIYIKSKREILRNGILLFTMKDDSHICLDCYIKPDNQDIRKEALEVNEDEKFELICDLCHKLPNSVWKSKCIQLFPCSEEWNDASIIENVGSWRNLYSILENTLNEHGEGFFIEKCRVSLFLKDFASIDIQKKYRDLDGAKYGWTLRCPLVLDPSRFIKDFDTITLPFNDKVPVELRCRHCSEQLFVVHSQEQVDALVASIARGKNLPMIAVDPIGVIFEKAQKMRPVTMIPSSQNVQWGFAKEFTLK